MSDATSLIQQVNTGLLDGDSEAIAMALEILAVDHPQHYQDVTRLLGPLLGLTGARR